MDGALRVFTGLTVISLLFLLAGGALIATNHTVGRRARRIFLWVVITLALVMLADWGNYVLDGTHPELRWFHTVSMALSFALVPPLPVLIASVIFPSRLDKPLLVIMGLQALLEFATIFGGFVFWVDATNTYHRGPLYGVYMASYTLSALYLVVVSLRGSRRYQAANAGVVLLILLCMTGGVAIQIAEPSVRTSWPAVGMAVLLYFQFYTEMVLHTDALTSLLNRHGYEEFLASPRLPCTIVAIDVDNFKQVNDTFGHAYGDECLGRIAGLILSVFGPVGLCYRTGGDEFTVVVTCEGAGVEGRMAELEARVSAAREADEHLPGVSLGHARAEADCVDIAQVVRDADRSMYAAKRARKARAQA